MLWVGIWFVCYVVLLFCIFVFVEEFDCVFFFRCVWLYLIVVCMRFFNVCLLILLFLKKLIVCCVLLLRLLLNSWLGLGSFVLCMKVSFILFLCVFVIVIILLYDYMGLFIYFYFLMMFVCVLRIVWCRFVKVLLC